MFIIRDLPLKLNRGVHVRGQGQKLDLVITSIIEEEEKFRSATLEVRGHTARGDYAVGLTIGEMTELNGGLRVKIREGNRGPLLSCHLEGYSCSGSKEYRPKVHEYSTP